MKKFFSLAVSLVLAYAAGYIGALFTIPQIDSWYQGLLKPTLNPPSWVFAPVWNTLYFLMALAAWFVWRTPSRFRSKALWLYGLQLVLNALWSFVFFGMHNLPLAVAVVVLLLLSIAATAALFFKIDRKAGWLMVPYILWVSFATYLTVSIFTIN